MDDPRLAVKPVRTAQEGPNVQESGLRAHMIAASDQIRAQVAAYEARSASNKHTIGLHTRLGLGLRHLDAVVAHLPRWD